MPQNQDLYMITRKQCRLSMFCFFGLQVLQQLINIIEILRNFVICNVPGLQLISQPSCYGIILCGQFRYPFPAKLGFLIKDWMTEKITNSFLLRLHVICLAPGITRLVNTSTVQLVTREATDIHNSGHSTT